MSMNNGFKSYTAYTINAKTNSVDEWICFGEMSGIYHKKPTRLCLLTDGRRQLVLPKKCVFRDRETALSIAKSK